MVAFIKIVEKFKHTASSQSAMSGGSFRRNASLTERNDRYGYARVHQTVSHALRHLSPLSAGEVTGIPKCMA